MRFAARETLAKGIKLGLLAALMVILRYPGEISTQSGTRWLWWTLAMIPFLIIVYNLVVGLSKSIDAQPASGRGIVSISRWVTLLS